MKNLILLVSFLIGLSAQAEITKGLVYEQGSQKKNLLYNWQNEVTEDGGITKSKASFFDLAGAPVVIEESEVRDGKLVYYTIEHKQTGKKGRIEVKGDRVHFTFEEEGKIKTDDEKLASNLVVPHTMGRFVQQNWDKISSGDTLDMRFGVWDRQETVGFSIFKIGETTIDGQKTMTMKMKPTSFVIAALVKPIIFDFSMDTKKLVAMNGRVQPKKKVGSDWKDLDAEVFYQVVK